MIVLIRCKFFFIRIWSFDVWEIKFGKGKLLGENVGIRGFLFFNNYWIVWEI